MSFVILGGSGFIGKHLASYLRSAGETVFVPERTHSDFKAFKDAHLIYAIGLTADFRERPFDTIEAHVSLAAQLLRECDFRSFLYLSSTRVYARSLNTKEGAPLPVLPIDASDLYNISKLAGEAVCFASGRERVRIARLSNVIGPRAAGTESFIGALCREARQGHIKLQTRPNSSKDYIWIDDVSSLLREIAVRGADRLYNVASGIQLTNAQWLSALAVETGCSFSVDQDAPSNGFPPISTERIRNEFDFHPEPVLEQISRIVGA